MCRCEIGEKFSQQYYLVYLKFGACIALIKFSVRGGL